MIGIITLRSRIRTTRILIISLASHKGRMRAHLNQISRRNLDFMRTRMVVLAIIPTGIIITVTTQAGIKDRHK